jgi:hypothetical protein
MIREGLKLPVNNCTNIVVGLSGISKEQVDLITTNRVRGMSSGLLLLLTYRVTNSEKPIRQEIPLQLAATIYQSQGS